MKNKRYIIKKGKALISFSDIGKTARMNGFSIYRFKRMIDGHKKTYRGWSVGYVK